MSNRVYDFENQKDLEEFLVKTNEVYRSGVTPAHDDPDFQFFISDAEYDILVNKLEQLNPDADFLSSIESEGLGESTFEHKEPMLSTQKLYTEKEIEQWLSKVKEVADDLGVELQLKITPKLDGFAGSLYAGVLATRGNGAVGNNISHIFKRGVVNVGLSDSRTSARGEIVIDKKYFEENLSDSFSHPRNFISSVLATETSNPLTEKALKDGAVVFQQYSALDNAIICSFEEFKEKLESYKKTILESTPYLIDGYVIEAVNPEIIAEMGHNNKFHRWQAAVKEVGEEVDVVVEFIDYQVGRSGLITPVINFKPTMISGAMVQRVTGSNYGLMVTRQIGVGSTISVIRSGEVIPKVIGVAKNKPDFKFQEVTHCPCCNSELVEIKSTESLQLQCTNEKCYDRLVQGVLHFFKTLNTSDGFGQKTVERIVSDMVGNGDDTHLISQFLELKGSDLETMGFGDGEVRVLLKAINDVKTKETADNLVLASVGISALGVRDSKKLLSHFTIDGLRDVYSVEDGVAKPNEFTIEGFGDIKKSYTADGLHKNQALIDYLVGNLNIKKTKVISEDSDIDTSNPLFGKRCVVTGRFVHKDLIIPREVMREQVESLGGIYQSGVNTKTDILILGSGGGSKHKKAQELGVQIIREDSEEGLDILELAYQSLIERENRK